MVQGPHSHFPQWERARLVYSALEAGLRASPETGSSPELGEVMLGQRVRPRPETSHFHCKEEPPEALVHASAQDVWVSPGCDRAGPSLIGPCRPGCRWLDSVFWCLLCPEAPWWLCWAQSGATGGCPGAQLACMQARGWEGGSVCKLGGMVWVLGGLLGVGGGALGW